MKCAMFFLAEYANMVNVSAVATTLFLGGWHAPVSLGIFEAGGALATISGIFWFTFKIFLLIMFYMWLRATLPRLRYDRLMKFTWKGLVPVALANIMLIAFLLTAFYQAKPGEEAATTTSQRNFRLPTSDFRLISHPKSNIHNSQ